MNNTIMFINSRLIKIFANLIKISCYAFHAIFPKKRFTIPSHAKPLFNAGKQLAIPKTLWQTNFTNKVTLPVYINYLFNRLLAYNYHYRFMGTTDCSEFIKSHFSADIFNSYEKIQIGAAQADFWRLLVLHKHGGVYMDIDAHLIRPLGSIIQPTQKELYIVMKNGELSNYFIASKNDNAHLKSLIDIVVNNIKENSIKNIYDLTGPGILSQVLDINKIDTTYYRYTCNQGNFTNEHFQYIDKQEGKWTKAQKTIDIIKK